MIPWDSAPPSVKLPCANNVEMGKALVGVMVHPNSKVASMASTPEHLSKLATEGTT